MREAACVREAARVRLPASVVIPNRKRNKRAVAEQGHPWGRSKLGGVETGSQILAALGFDRSLRSLSLRSLVYLGTLAQSMTREPPAL